MLPLREPWPGQAEEQLQLFDWQAAHVVACSPWQLQKLCACQDLADEGSENLLPSVRKFEYHGDSRQLQLLRFLQAQYPAFD